jgi:hypothetical protein
MCLERKRDRTPKLERTIGEISNARAKAWAWAKDARDISTLAALPDTLSHKNCDTS